METGRDSALIVACLVIALVILPWDLPAAGAPRFNFVVLGDRTAAPAEGVYESVLDEVALISPDFLITVGDHIDGYEADPELVEAQWDEYVDLVESAGVKYYMTPGNHDIWDAASLDIFKSRFGNPDRTFEYKSNLFVILDVSTLYSAEDLPRAKIQWLEKSLGKSGEYKNVFVFYHKPFWCEDFSRGRPNLLHEMFKTHGVRAVFTGHYHRHFHTVRDGVEYFGVSTSGGTLAGGGAESGAFYSYLLAAVVGDSLVVRVARPGRLESPGVVSYEERLAMAELEARSVRLSETVVDGTFSGIAKVTVSIDNAGATTVRDTAEWVLRGGWTVEPLRDYVEVPAGETGTLSARAVGTEPLFPVPLLRLRLPYDGKTVNIVKPLNVKRLLVASRARGVQVDAVLYDEAWIGLASTGIVYGPERGRALRDSTSLRVCYDSVNVYFAVECFDRDPSRVKAAATGRDGFVGYDDHVTFLLQPRRESEVFYEISVTPLGTLSDQAVEVCPFGTYVLNPEWDAPASASARVSGDRWIVEVAVPVASLGTSVSAGSQWGFNFMRMHRRHDTTSDYQFPYRYRSDGVGLLEFE